MTREEFDVLCRDICPHCRVGIVARLRTDSGEWVHDKAAGKTGFAHTICMATHFRDIAKAKLSG